MAELLDKRIDLTSFCLPNPDFSFFMRVAGDSMINAGILDGDIVAVDKSLEAVTGDIVIASINGCFTLKEICITDQVTLLPHNDNFPIIMIKNDDDFEVFGVVVSVVRKFTSTKI